MKINVFVRSQLISTFDQTQLKSISTVLYATDALANSQQLSIATEYAKYAALQISAIFALSRTSNDNFQKALTSIQNHERVVLSQIEKRFKDFESYTEYLSECETVVFKTDSLNIETHCSVEHFLYAYELLKKHLESTATQSQHNSSYLGDCKLFLQFVENIQQALI